MSGCHLHKASHELAMHDAMGVCIADRAGLALIPSLLVDTSRTLTVALFPLLSPSPPQASRFKGSLSLSSAHSFSSRPLHLQSRRGEMQSPSSGIPAGPYHGKRPAESWATRVLV